MLDDADRAEGPADHLRALPTGRTRWRRAAVVLVPGVLAVSILGTAMVNGAVAASIGVSGNRFLVTADRVTGDGVAAYPTSITTPKGRSQESVLLGFKNAQIENLCLSSRTDLPLVGPIALVLRAGSGGAVRVTDFIASADDVRGARGTLSGFAVGVDASTLERVPGTRGPEGRFGIDADRLTVRDFRSSASLVTGGTFDLEGLQLGARRGARDAC